MIEEGEAASQSSRSSKKREDPKVPCKYCDSEVRKSNMSAHVFNNCKIFNLWGKSKSDIDKLIAGENVQVEGLKSMNNSLMEENLALKKKIEEILMENLALKKQNMELEELAEVKGNFKIKFSRQNIETMINQAGLSESTKAGYHQVWTAYVDWCGWMNDSESPKNPFLVTTANDYLCYYFNKEKQYTATLNKIKNVIQSLIRIFTSRNVKLKKFRGPLKFKRERNTLSKQQLDDYFDFLKSKKSETYYPQLVQAKLGGRINSIANLEKKHLKFLSNSSKIVLPDCKTGDIVKYADEELTEILTKYCQENEQTINDRGGYLFYAGTSDDHRLRSRFLGSKVNEELKMFARRLNLQNLTSHDLRRSYCEISLNELQAKSILDEVSKRVGHKNHSVTRNHYLTKKSLNLNIEEVIDMIVKVKEKEPELTDDSRMLQKKSRRHKKTSGMIQESEEETPSKPRENRSRGKKPVAQFKVSPVEVYNELTRTTLMKAVDERQMTLTEDLVFAFFFSKKTYANACGFS